MIIEYRAFYYEKSLKQKVKTEKFSYMTGCKQTMSANV